MWPVPLAHSHSHSRLAFPYVFASCCGNFLHILATTFSTSLEFLLVSFSFFSHIFFFIFPSCVNKSQKRRRQGVCLCLCWPAPEVENSLNGNGVACHRRGLRYGSERWPMGSLRPLDFILLWQPKNKSNQQSLTPYLILFQFPNCFYVYTAIVIFVEKF